MNPHVGHELSIKSLLGSFLKNRALIYQMSKREVVGRYRGSVLGIAWSFFNPLIMLIVYTIVFSTIFRMKWDVGSDSKTEFALVLFIGMIVHGILAEALVNSPSLIMRHTSYVKKIVFPLDALSWIVIGSTMFHAMISVIVWILFYLVVNHSLQWTIVFLPLVLLPLVAFSLGVSWILASLGVYIRDIGQMMGVLVTILLFMSPIFYPVTMLPENYRIFIYLNPLTFIVEQSRAVMIWGEMPDWGGLALAMLVGVAVMWSGYAWFQKTRKGFADVI